MKLRHHILKLLERLGLNEHEALFYLMVYQHPHLTIPQVQKLCGFSRATAYRVFDQLREKRFLLVSPESWRQNLRVISLHALADKVGRESLKLRKVELELKRLDHFIDFQGDIDRVEPVEIFTDQDQITEHCYRLLHADWQHIDCYGSGEKAYEIPGEQAMHHFVTMRARKGKTINAVFTELGEHTVGLLKKNETELRNGKLFLDTTCQQSMTYIYDKQVSIWQWDQTIGKRLLLINDPSLIQIYQSHFQKSWRALS
ncbi:hypothetical protein KA517_01935, partial [Candidatus Gracilibacteria bacterium]|nr:hypothetical protein [Candidatus Gracilibacteria bacterium]